MTKPLAIFDWSGVISDDFELVLRSVNKVLNSFGKEQVDADYLRSSFSAHPSQFYINLGIETKDLEQVKALYEKSFRRGPIPKPIPNAVETIIQVVELSDVLIFSSHPQELLTREVRSYRLDNIQSIE